MAPGRYTVEVCITGLEDGTAAPAVIAERSVTVEILDAVLPPARRFHTEWFHADCLADYYRVAPYSEEHWRIIRNFLETAARRSINTILVPVLTPSLDVAFGHERTNVQLVKIIEEERGRVPFRLLPRGALSGPVRRPWVHRL